MSDYNTLVLHGYAASLHPEIPYSREPSTRRYYVSPMLEERKLRILAMAGELCLLPRSEKGER
jgi:hypothetical protein